MATDLYWEEAPLRSSELNKNKPVQLVDKTVALVAEF